MNSVSANSILRKAVTDYRANGVLVLRGLFKKWMRTLDQGAKRNIEKPGPRAITHCKHGSNGQFLEDFCNWNRIPEYKDFIVNSPMAEIAAMLMESQSVQFFHDHYLHKEAGSLVATPWHQDMPYYCVDGNQTVSFWIPLNPVAIEYSLECVTGSHAWPKLIRPTSWSSSKSFYSDDSSFMDLPDIYCSEHSIRVWDMQPGDAIAFNFKTVHRSNANTETTVKRTLSFRLLGDDVRYLERPGRTSPNFPDINQKNGERLREDWFPTLI